MYLISDIKGNYYKISECSAFSSKSLFSKTKKGKALIIWDSVRAAQIAMMICKQQKIPPETLIVALYDINEKGENKKIGETFVNVQEELNINLYKAVRNDLVSKLMWNREDNRFWGIEDKSWFVQNGDRMDWKATVVINGNPDNFTLTELQILSEISRIRTESYDSLGFYRKGMNLTILTKDEGDWLRRRAVSDSYMGRYHSLYDMINKMTDLENAHLCGEKQFKNYKKYLLSIAK